jgi:hypothetical protein
MTSRNIPSWPEIVPTLTILEAIPLDMVTNSCSHEAESFVSIDEKNGGPKPAVLKI